MREKEKESLEKEININKSLIINLGFSTKEDFNEFRELIYHFKDNFMMMEESSSVLKTRLDNFSLQLKNMGEEIKRAIENNRSEEINYLLDSKGGTNSIEGLSGAALNFMLLKDKNFHEQVILNICAKRNILEEIMQKNTSTERTKYAKALIKRVYLADSNRYITRLTEEIEELKKTVKTSEENNEKF